MGKIKRSFLILTVIIIVGAFLRLYNLNSVPPSLSLDEVSIGYNAYSILKTGADEYGTKFPILLRAYDDWRPALYVYLVIPFIQVLGLDILAVRLPSVILSMLTVLATYFLVKELFKNSSLKLDSPAGGVKLEVPIIAVAMLAISPWHIYISRLGHEVNPYLTFVVFGLLFFLRFIRLNNMLLLILSSIFFALSFYTYQSSKIFVPLIIFLLGFLFRNKLYVRKKEVFISGLLGLIIIFPILKASLEPNALIRLEGTSVFSAQQHRFEKRALLFKDAVDRNNIIGQVIYNRRILALQIFAEGYISHFNPRWLFANLDEDKHKVPNFGLLYIWEAPLMLLGLYFLIRSQVDKAFKALIVFWILASPLAASIATDAPHAMRSYTFLPMVQILAGLGIIQLISLFKKYNIGFILFAALITIVAVSIINLYKQYFNVFPKTQSQSFQYALAKAIPVVLEKEKQYETIVFSNRDNLYQSYMFFLYYSDYDPFLYQKQGGTRSGGFEETHKISKFEFKPIDWEKEKRELTLFVGNPSDFPKEAKAIKILTYLNGNEGVKIVAK